MQVTGTTLAVICEDQGTCVCVFEGTVRVGARGAAPEAVTNGRRRFVFHDGRPPESAEIRVVERAELGRFRERRGSWLESGSE